MLYYAKVYLPVFSLLLHCTVRMEAALNAPIQLAHVNHILKKICLAAVMVHTFIPLSLS